MNSELQSQRNRLRAKLVAATDGGSGKDAPAEQLIRQAAAYLAVVQEARQQGLSRNFTELLIKDGRNSLRSAIEVRRTSGDDGFRAAAAGLAALQADAGRFYAARRALVLAGDASGQLPDATPLDLNGVASRITEGIAVARERRAYRRVATSAASTYVSSPGAEGCLKAAGAFDRYAADLQQRGVSADSVLGQARERTAWFLLAAADASGPRKGSQAADFSRRALEAALMAEQAPETAVRDLARFRVTTAALVLAQHDPLEISRCQSLVRQRLDLLRPARVPLPFGSAVTDAGISVARQQANQLLEAKVVTPTIQPKPTVSVASSGSVSPTTVRKGTVMKLLRRVAVAAAVAFVVASSAVHKAPAHSPSAVSPVVHSIVAPHPTVGTPSADIGGGAITWRELSGRGVAPTTVPRSAPAASAASTLPPGARTVPRRPTRVAPNNRPARRAAVAAAPVSLAAGIGFAARAAYDAGFRGQNLVIAVAISGAESGYRVGAQGHNSNGTVDRGLWQINSCHTQFDGTRLLTDAVYNAQAAFAISGGHNWRPWTTFTSGAYLRDMAAAQTAVNQLAASGVGVG